MKKASPPATPEGLLQSVKKASQNSPPVMAANKLNHFLPRHVRGKKYFARRECFSAHLWAEKRGSERFLILSKKGYALF